MYVVVVTLWGGAIDWMVLCNVVGWSIKMIAAVVT